MPRRTLSEHVILSGSAAGSTQLNPDGRPRRSRNATECAQHYQTSINAAQRQIDTQVLERHLLMADEVEAVQTRR